MKHILKSTNLKERIRIFILLTTGISFLFFSIATNYVNKSLFLKNTSQLMLKNFDLTRSNLESIAEDSKNACAIIENDKKIHDFIEKEKDFIYEGGNAFYEYYVAYLSMQDTIIFLSDTYDIDGISIYTNSGCIYGKNGKTYFDKNHIKNSKWYKSMESRKESALFCSSDYFSEQEQIVNGDLCYIKLLRSRISGKYIGAIRITISSDHIKSLLSSSSSNLICTTYLQNDIGEILTPFDNYINIDIKPTSKQTLSYDGNSVIICQELTGTNLFLLSITSYKDAMTDFNKIRLLIYAVTIIILIISYKMSKFFAAGITKRLSKMMDSMDNIKYGIFEPVSTGDYNDDIELCIKNYNYMLSEFQALLDEQKQHEAQKRNLQLKILQEQIKPHFLYNTLELINSAAIINNIPEISEIVLELSSFYRLSLSQGDDFHTLKDELHHISLYFSLQNKRAQKYLLLDVNAPKELLNASVPKLLLQPIIENSYYHAFPLSLNKENAKIEVSVKKHNDDIFIKIYDNGVGIPYDRQESILETESKDGFGLRNINERIKLFYGNNYGLSVSSKPGVETIVTIKLPYRPMQNDF
ncbi:MAG: histidine kinase [Firmicutes bacterium]|nr:histidine kinase [Bacillota bacterium]